MLNFPFLLNVSGMMLGSYTVSFRSAWHGWDLGGPCVVVVSLNGPATNLAALFRCSVWIM